MTESIYQNKTQQQSPPDTVRQRRAVLQDNREQVMQQAQGRVKAKTSVGGVSVNDNAGLEKEADVWGGRALQMVGKSIESEPIDTVGQKKSNVKQVFGFVDNRPEAVAQRKLQEVVNNHSSAQPLNQSKVEIRSRNNNRCLAGKAPVQLAGNETKKKLAIGASVLGGGALIGGLVAGSMLTGGLGLLGLAGGLGYLGYKGYKKRKRGSAEKIRERAAERSKRRKGVAKFSTGRYDTSVGPVSVSGMNKQRISLTRKADYEGHTMGSIPPYSKMMDGMEDEDVRFIHDPDALMSSDMGTQRRMGTALALTASSVSENDKAPGIGKMIRAFARRFTSTGGASPHPLSSSINPAVTSAVDARAFMDGSDLTEDQRRAIEGHASDSSDEGEPHYAERTSLLRRRDS